MFDENGIWWMPAGGPPPRMSTPPPHMTWHEHSFRLFWDGHIKASHYPCVVYGQMFDWLIENIKGKPRIYNLAYGQRPGSQTTIRDRSQFREGHIAVHFKNKEDAMAFKLRWS